jgi:hypothetical protein
MNPGPCPIARAHRTPRVYLGEILNNLATITHGESPSAFAEFIEGTYAESRRAPRDDVDSWMADLVALQHRVVSEKRKPTRRVLQQELVRTSIRTAAAFCACAESALLAGQMQIAWSYLMDAQAIRASLATTASIALKGPTLASDVARKNALKLHEEHHGMKDDVLAHFERHKHEYKTLNEAAESIAGKVVPLSFRTVREYLIGQKLPQV